MLDDASFIPKIVAFHEHYSQTKLLFIYLIRLFSDRNRMIAYATAFWTTLIELLLEDRPLSQSSIAIKKTGYFGRKWSVRSVRLRCKIDKSQESAFERECVNAGKKPLQAFEVNLTF